VEGETGSSVDEIGGVGLEETGVDWVAEFGCLGVVCGFCGTLCGTVVFSDSITSLFDNRLELIPSSLPS
jgi:hypothetical protein